MEEIRHEGQILAIVVRHDFSKHGISFFTPPEYSQQLAFMRHPAGKTIEPHAHNAVKREVLHTNEVLVIRKGLLRTDFYDDQDRFISSLTLGAGDVILLVSGGHGFKVLEEVEMLEIKQGPYAGENDKRRFVPKGKNADD